MNSKRKLASLLAMIFMTAGLGVAAASPAAADSSAPMKISCSTSTNSNSTAGSARCTSNLYDEHRVLVTCINHSGRTGTYAGPWVSSYSGATSSRTCPSGTGVHNVSADIALGGA